MKEISDAKTCFGYIRVSTDDQLEYSPDSQVRLLQEYAAKNNMKITDIFKDLGISGRNVRKRPEFQKMIERAMKNECQAILVWKFSRFARNQEESVIYKSMLRRAGVEVISISEELPDDWLASHLVEAVYEIMDEQYSRNLSMEVKRGMTQKALEGGYNGSIPMGYIKNSKGSSAPIPDSNYAPIIRRIFDEFLQGKPLSDIAFRLNEEGYRTRRKGKFEIRTIKYIIQNPFYAGYVRFNYFDRATGRYRENPIITKASHTPIIDKNIFDMANKRLNSLKTAKRTPRTSPSVRHWLSGLVCCSACGGTLGYSAKSKSVKVAHFQCWRAAKGQCNCLSYCNGAALEKNVIEGLENILLFHVIPYTKIKSDNPNTDKQYYYLNKLNSLEKKQQRIREAYINGVDTLEEYSSNKEIIVKEKLSLQQKIKEFSDTINSLTNDNNINEQKIYNIIDLLNYETDYIKKANCLRAIIEKIVYDKSNQSLQFYLYTNET